MRRSSCTPAQRRLDADMSRLQRQHLRERDRLAGGYNRALQARVKRTSSELLKALSEVPSAPRLDEEGAALTQAEHIALLMALGRFITAWQRSEDPDEQALQQLFSRADTQTTRIVRRSIARVVGGRGLREFLLELPAVDPLAMRAEFVQANVALIKSIDARYFADIRRIVDEAYADGRDWTWLTQRFGERYDVSKARAQLLARDQLGKLSSQITQVRCLELGVESYQWMTSNDERVRESHERLAGRIIRYDQPPSEGHAGMAVQCRCGQRPVVSERHAELLRAEAEARLLRTAELLPRSPIVTGEIVPIPSRAISRQRIEQFRGEFRRVA